MSKTSEAEQLWNTSSALEALARALDSLAPSVKIKIKGRLRAAADHFSAFVDAIPDRGQHGKQ